MLEHTFPLVRVQEEHLAVMALEVTSGPGGVSRVEPQRLASWRHPGPVTALQVRAPAQSGRWQLARLSKKCTIESSSETSSAGGSTESQASMAAVLAKPHRLAMSCRLTLP